MIEPWPELVEAAEPVRRRKPLHIVASAAEVGDLVTLPGGGEGRMFYPTNRFGQREPFVHGVPKLSRREKKAAKRARRPA